MRTKAIFLSAAFMLCVTFQQVQAQTATDQIQHAALEYAQGYANPLANMLSAVFNSGQYHTADASGFHIYVSLQATGAFVPNSEKTFSTSFYYNSGNDPNLPPQLRGLRFYEHFTGVPTVLGGTSNTYLIDTTLGGQPYRYGKLPDGINANFVPLIIPHIEIGSVLGTELLLRFLPASETNTSIGKINFYGVGLRHSISQYIPLLPVDISAQVMYQHLGAGDLLTMDAWNIAALASIDLPIITLYGGVQLEQASMDVHYTFNEPGLPMETVDLGLQSTHNARFTLGATLKFLILYINAQFTVAPVSTFGAGVGIRIPPSIL